MRKHTKKTCSLECKGGAETSEPIHEFVGPVKITFIDPKRSDYIHKKWGPAVMTSAYVLLIVVLATVIFATLTMQMPIETILHIAACMIGFHLLTPTAILLLDPMFGGGTYLNHNSKRYQHILLQCLAIFYILGGVINLSTTTSITSSMHGIIGLSATIFICLEAVLGLLAFFQKSNNLINLSLMILIHKIIGMLILLLSLVTFCTGVLRAEFMSWSYTARLPELPYVLLGFSILYTMCILVSIYWRLSVETGDS